MKNKLTIALILLCLIIQSSKGQNILSALKTDLQKTLDRIVAENNLPGMTLAIEFDAENKIHLASGFADREQNRRMQVGDRMLAGSVGKMFVSALALQQVSKGKIQLKDKIEKYFGQLDWFSRLPNAKTIRIQDLLQHTSGLPRYIFQPEFLANLKANPLQVRSPEQCIAYVLDKAAVHPAGQGWGYSDTNYLLLGLIIEKVTGKKYYDLLRQNFLIPLQLQQTTPSTQRRLTGLVQGYIGSQNIFGLPKQVLQDDQLAVNPAFEWTGGGVVTTVGDLASWTRRLHQGEVLDSLSYTQLTRAVSMSTGAPSDQGYGLGSFVWSKREDTRYGHAGFFPGYLTQVEYSRRNHYAIAIQVNTDDGYARLQQYIHDLDAVILRYLPQLDEAKIRHNFKKQEDCWNVQDIECYMQAYASGQPIQTASRAGITYGYDNILSDYRKYFPKERMGQLHFEHITPRRLAADLYFVTGQFNLKLPGREELYSGWFSVVMQRIKGEWYLITDHSS